jgi:hypothetical protein
MKEPWSLEDIRLAQAIGVVALGSAACLATYFAVGGPFGTINDVSNAATGVLGAALAWRLRRRVQHSAAKPALAAAIAGAGLTVAGSALVISGATGFVLAGLVSSVGFAGIGTWLLLASRRGDTHAKVVPARRLGIAAGALMALGIVGAPGIALRIDDFAGAPWWVFIGLTGWLGTYVAFPIWALRAGATAAAAAASGDPALASSAAE